jgi:alkyldihydroxyacetonephosphate synthase
MDGGTLIPQEGIAQPMQARTAKWWGWGFDDRAVPLESKPGLQAFLQQALDLPSGDLLRVPDPRDITVPASRLSLSDQNEFQRIVGEEGIASSDFDRLTHATGKSYRDLLRLRLGRIPRMPDLVLFPEEDEDVRRILEFCAAQDFAVIPFGGGSSVVGGLEVAETPRPHVTLDLRRMRRVLAIDEVSHTATAQAGIRGPLLEEVLQARQLTVGHFPQSFEFSTLGGWIAARSTGAWSNRYGKIEDLVAGVRLIAPSGTFDLRSRPRHAMGSDLLGLAVGSEGTLGVITQATVRVHRAAQDRAFESIVFPSFPDGLEALRAMAQDGVPPDMAYLMDEEETRLDVATAGGARGIGPALLRARGFSLDRASILLLGYEGARDVVKEHLSLGRKYCRAGLGIGAGPAEKYSRERYDTPYLRDSLIDHRILVDTAETATVWSNVERLYRAVCKALLEGMWSTGVKGLVGCHVSHVYSEGASLYFTYMAAQKRGDELAQYDSVKAAVTRAIIDAGGNLSHHHGIGLDHAPYLREALGDEAWRLLREVKRTLDPKGIMNPGTMFPVGG